MNEIIIRSASRLHMHILLALISWLVTSTAIAEPAIEAAKPYTLASVRVWQKSMEPWPWHYPPEQEVELHGSQKQLMEAVAGGARSGLYIIFAKIKGKWTPISDAIDQAHLPVRVLPRSIKGWHDFQSFVPLWGSGGNEVLVVTYRWNGRKYLELKRQEGQFSDF